MKLNLSTKNAAIAIVLGLDIVFLAVYIIFAIRGVPSGLADKLWGVFLGTNGALFLILNADAKSGSDKPQDPTQPGV